MQKLSCQRFRRTGIGRRDFFYIGGASLFGLTIAEMLAGRALAAAPKPKADHVILFWLGGGPPHQDTFDLKPEAPAEIRGEFKPVSTRTPGTQVCEHLPRLGRLSETWTVVRSMTTNSNGHEPACQGS